MELSTHSRIREIGEADWDALLADDDPPFLRFAWLDALEETGCVKAEFGWQPVHLAFREEGRLVAAAPAYLKGHSDGEFVFDHSWARFAMEQLRIDYYPKLLIAVPFTPVPGRRLLVVKGEDPARIVAAFRSVLDQLLGEYRLSSAHVLFPTSPQGPALESVGLIARANRRFVWSNRGYQTFDDFLGQLKAKRRAQIRRERRDFRDQGFELTTYTGTDVTPVRIDAAFEFYVSTIENHGYWGRQYLTRDFFHEACTKLRDAVHLVFATQRGVARPIAGAVNFSDSKQLYGRYWGARGAGPFLHFNVCYYKGIEDCIAQGLSVFDPGVGGEHKLVRGFEPTLDVSMHHIRNETLARIIASSCREEVKAVARVVDQERGASGYRAGDL